MTLITHFFVDYIVNANLGMVANAHLAHADASPDGARDPRCLELARLHSLAVDYPKTGVPAVLGLELRPKSFPDFMENKTKPKYEAQKV